MFFFFFLGGVGEKLIVWRQFSCKVAIMEVWMIQRKTHQWQSDLILFNPIQSNVWQWSTSAGLLSHLLLIWWSAQKWLANPEVCRVVSGKKTFGNDGFTVWFEGGFVIDCHLEESEWFIQNFSIGLLVVDWQAGADREDLKEINSVLLSIGRIEIKVFQRFEVMKAIPLILVWPFVPKLNRVYLSLIFGL